MLVVSTLTNLGFGATLPDIIAHQTIHICAEVVALAGWRICRAKRQLSPAFLAALDALLTISLSTAWAMLGTDTPAKDPIEFTIMLATTYTLILRSVVVPSTFFRT